MRKEDIMKKYWVVVCFLFFSVALAHGGDVITLRADIWEPYNCDPNATKPGFMIDVAKAIFTKAGYQVDYQSKGWTWDRSIEEARKGRIDAIVGASKDDAPDFVFPEEPFIVQRMSAFVKKGNPWRYSGVDSLAKVKLGVISGYAYEESIDAYVEKNANQGMVQIIKDANALDLNIKKLVAGRIDVTIEDAAVFNAKATALGMGGQFDEAGTVGSPDNVTIAFSPAKESSKKYSEILSQGLKEMRASGALKEMLDRYGLKDEPTAKE
jgi:polar amino acid transport system substrate-binding protein